ncbi:MAG: dihydrolipoyl dehydrogenase [Propionibacteriaceae bacterium]|jgi:dihydrolipoamide dehydrogenase|nr:dihydrolipoyl dehydrogenase [Propionibacteriaceae bacterium]
MSDYDVIVLGAGPGGYLAAERLGHAGKKVCLIEKEYLGGTCLNVGCIPTKSLLNSAKQYEHALHAEQFGVTASGVEVDWAKVQAWKAQVVKTLVGGVGAAEKKAKVEVIMGEGKLLGPGKVEVNGEVKSADHIIIATGSTPAMPPIPGTKDNPKVLDSTGLLAIDHIPGKLAVIGGGVIGVEFASLFAALGTEVTVVEMLPEILPFMDDEMAAKLRKGTKGVTFNLGCQVKAVEDGTLVFADAKGQEQRLEADVILMAVGRRPLVEGWGAKEAGLEYTPKGIAADDTMRTNLPNVWAVGDVTGKSLLAHAAYRMAEIAVSHILDTEKAAKTGQILRTNTIPWAVYSMPEAAGVGLTEAQALAQGYEIAKATVPLLLSGRFIAENGMKAPGAVKLIADKATGVVLGITVLGPYAPEMIWGAATALELELTVEDLRQVVFPHPTVSEGIREAAWAVKL